MLTVVPVRSSVAMFSEMLSRRAFFFLKLESSVIWRQKHEVLSAFQMHSFLVYLHLSHASPILLLGGLEGSHIDYDWD